MQNPITDKAFCNIFRDVTAVVHSSKNCREMQELIVSAVTGILKARGKLPGITDFEKDKLVPGAFCSLREQFCQKQENLLAIWRAGRYSETLMRTILYHLLSLSH